MTAANGSQIVTYGERLIELDFGSGRVFTWVFIVADVSTAILGVDFLAAHKFIVDVEDCSITDRVTGKFVAAPAVAVSDASRITAGTLPDNTYSRLLADFPSLTQEASARKCKHNIVHRIKTTGGPVYCRPRRLRPEIYAVVKAAFSELLARGIVSRSDSAWSSPLHVVPKKDDSWRPVGDYRALNNLTARDTYPLPHLHTFADSLFGTSVYSKVGLKEAFLQIPVHPDDIAKTNITTPFGAFQYNYMSYGLSGASQSFQRFIDTVLRDLCVID